jgi:hypothetical protein
MKLTCIALLAAALPAGAQAAAPEPAPSCPPASHFTTIRLSRISPGGSMAGFRKAMADQKAWYAAHKLPDRLFMAPVVTRVGGRPLVSDREAMSFHVHLADRAKPFPAKDAGWNAFVAAFKANSQIESTSYVCLPD